MKNIFNAISKQKNTLSEIDYIRFLISIKEYCENEISENDGEKYKNKLLKFFDSDKKIYEFINSCKIYHTHNSLCLQKEYISINKIIISNKNIYLTIKLSHSESDNYGDGPEEIEIELGRDKIDKTEILRERCVCSNETFENFLSSSDFQRDFMETYNSIKNTPNLIESDDLFAIIKYTINIII